MIRLTALVLGTLLSMALLASPASAQLTGTLQFQLAPTSEYFDDCDPGTFCLVVYCGLIDGGTMTFDYVGFDGTYDNYDVTVDWPIHVNFCPPDLSGPTTPFIGSGTFQIDREPTPSQRLIVDLTRPNGPDITADSGLVTPAVPFPQFVGFEALSFDTSEYFSIDAELVQTDDPFVRGDSNDDGNVDIADSIYSANSLFVPGSPAPNCLDSADANDDGNFDIADVIWTANYLFIVGSPAPPAPFPGCGTDPTGDALGCEAFAGCP